MLEAGEVGAEAEVNDLDADHLLLIEHHHNVFGLEVAVHDPKGMQVPQAYDQLLCDLGCVVLLQEALLADEIEEVTALHQLSHNVDVRPRPQALLEPQQERV